MIEYCIYIRHGTSSSFRTLSYNTFNEVFNALHNMISDYDYKGKIYYVDNKFFDNKFPPHINNSTYYQIQERFVESWQECYEESRPKKVKNKIINFPKIY